MKDIGIGRRKPGHRWSCSFSEADCGAYSGPFLEAFVYISQVYIFRAPSSLASWVTYEVDLSTLQNRAAFLESHSPSCPCHLRTRLSRAAYFTKQRGNAIETDHVSVSSWRLIITSSAAMVTDFNHPVIDHGLFLETMRKE